MADFEKEQLGDDAKLIVLADPSTLGEFRKHRSARLEDRIIAEIDKDVVNQPPDQIAKVITAFEP